MKKLILAIAFMGLGIMFSNAQTTTAPGQEKKQGAAAKMTGPKAANHGAVVSTVAKSNTPGKKSAANGKGIKKDGTPDKRFKANKEVKGQLKKDGTPDKRYKENKEAKPATK